MLIRRLMASPTLLLRAFRLVSMSSPPGETSWRNVDCGAGPFPPGPAGICDGLLSEAISEAGSG
jgi:hypothetical protein